MDVINIIVVDAGHADSGSITEMFESDADINVVVSTDDIFKATKLVMQHRPDLLLVEASQLHGADASLVSLLYDCSPETKVVLLTDDTSDDDVLACLIEGAKGYLNRHQTPEVFAKMVKAIYHGEAWVPRTMVALLIDNIAMFNHGALAVATH